MATVLYNVAHLDDNSSEDLYGKTGTGVGGSSTDGPVRVWLGYTKPSVMTSVGCPSFKTQKLLKDRAIVSDTFTWQYQDYRFVAISQGGDGSSGDYSLEPGYGQYAHRDGYNVLYGDWSAKWYGDPQQRVLWPKWDGQYLDIRNENAMGRLMGTNYVHIRWDKAHDNFVHNTCSTLIWNTFDMDKGIDLHDSEPETGQAP